LNLTSAEAGRDLYQAFVKGEIVLTDATTAEMVKLIENTYRDVNIAIANEFSRISERLCVDISEAISIANRHPRVKILSPGPGVGGHCISVDPWFLVEAAPDLARLIWTTRQVNDEQPHFVVEMVKKNLLNLKGQRILALGLSFKANVDDLRESPAVEVVRLLQKEGADVVAYEPYQPNPQIPEINCVPTLDLGVENCDAIIFLVSHKQFIDIDPYAVAAKTTAKSVFIATTGFNSDIWKKAGFRVVNLGNGRR
jgi:UDP-N-acetyl-D-mannosaminuronic acid dehydrogenase